MRRTLLLIPAALVALLGCGKGGSDTPKPPAQAQQTESQQLVAAGAFTATAVQLTDNSGSQAELTLPQWGALVPFEGVTFHDGGTATLSGGTAATWTLTQAGALYTLSITPAGGQAVSAAALIGSPSGEPGVAQVTLILTGSYAYQGHTYQTLAETLQN